MRRDLAVVVTELGTPHRLIPRPFDLAKCPAVIVTNIDCVRPIDPTPAPKMRQDPLAEPHDRRSLVLLVSRTRGPATHSGGLKVYPFPPKLTNRFRPAAGIETEQNEPSKMCGAPCRPEQPRRL